MRAAQGVTAAALVLFVLALVPGQSGVASQSDFGPPVGDSSSTTELVTIDQMAPTSFKVHHLGSIDGPRGRALRQLLDGDASGAR